MSTVNKLVVLALFTCLLVYHVECRRTRSCRHRADSSRSGDKDRRPKQHDDVEFPYKLENAPIPSVHDGPQVLRLRTSSVSYTDSRGEDLEYKRVRRHTSKSSTLNPQKPYKNNEEASHQEINENVNENIGPKNFHHPGHSSELVSSHPKSNYNYYKTLNMYGSAFQYGNSQPFKGYVQTANIGVVPPRGVNAKNYYNSISGLSDYPVVKQHSNNGLSQSLYGNQENYGYGYGYGGRDYVKNAYKNVLTGLAMWSILNGLVNGQRYTVYNHTNLPQDYAKNIILSNDSIVSCFEDAAALCSGHAQPLCINNGTAFCVSSAVVPCQGEALGNSCVKISVPCDNCEDGHATHLPCAANITVFNGALDKEKFNNTLDSSDDSDDKDVVLCVTSLIVPQVKNVYQVQNKTEKKGTNMIKNTTDADK